ncbi:2-succinyl-6-hydroxy-2,4-cyclohexadiene-1-carboxylate synthase [Bacillus gobiensis]|uniref:2-succinyl-6-hydroxy-2, 4-cyclohexadiene-1-carboxylate synthase n=1 Tax=Bacillus gobiensis TaxID=1441095 RepID=UPI003D226C5B
MAVLRITLADGVTYELYDNNKKSAETILFFHGFTGSAKSWEPMEPLLSDKRIIRISLLGHGGTDSPVDSKRYSAHRQAQDLLELIKSLQLHKVCLIGYSMGGRLALYFSMLYPGRVSRLILESSSPGLMSLHERKARIAQDRKLADLLVNEGLSKFVDYWGNIPLFDSQKRLPIRVRNQQQTERLNNNPIGLANSLSGFGTGAQPSLWEKLHELKIPVLLITGQLDEKFCRINKKLDKKLENSCLQIFEHAGHTVHLECPEAFGKLVNEFVS